MSLNTTTDAPYVETPTDVVFDRVNLMASHTIAATAYGIVVTLFGICVRLLLLNVKRNGIRQTAFHLTYASAMLVLGTLYVSSGARTVQLAYVDHREFVQGPEAFTEAIFSQPITILGSAPFIMANWFANAFFVCLCTPNLFDRISCLMCACIDLAMCCDLPRDTAREGFHRIPMFIVDRFPRWVAHIDAVLYSTNFSQSVMGIFTLVQSSRPNQSFWSTNTVDFGLAYFSISTALTVLISTLILARLIMFRRQLTGTNTIGSCCKILKFAP